MPSTQRVALITGCSKPESLGAAFALDLLGRGYRVFATARKVETMQGLADAGCEVLGLDVTSDDSVRAAADAVKDKAGRLDLLINNAGTTGASSLLDTSLDHYRHALEINVLGHLRVTQACTGLLVVAAKSKSGSESGKRALVINIGSMASNGNPWFGVYGACKGALASMTSSLASELDPLGIDVTLANLGLLNTPFSQFKKPFTLIADVESRTGLYPDFQSNHAGMLAEFIKVVAMCPLPEEVVKQVLDETETPNAKGQTVPRVVQAGKTSF